MTLKEVGKFGLDLLTVLCLIALAAVATFRARSNRYPDTIHLYHDPDPLGPNGPKGWDERSAWRDREVRSFPGRFEAMSVWTTVPHRRRGPNRGPGIQPAAYGGGGGLALFRRDPPEGGHWAPDWPTPPGLWHNFGFCRIDQTDENEHKDLDLTETRRTQGGGVAAPYWALAAVLLPLPGCRLAAALRHLRAPAAVGGGVRGLARGLIFASLALLLAGTSAAWAFSYVSLYEAEQFTAAWDGVGGGGASRWRHVRKTLYSNRGELSVHVSVDQYGTGGPWLLLPGNLSVRPGPPRRDLFRPRPVSGVRIDRLGLFLMHEELTSPGQPATTSSLVLLPRLHTEWVAAVPYWSLTALAAVLPGNRLIRQMRDYRQRRRARHGLCRRCGYDLRATPNRCPECGAAAAGLDEPTAAPG